MAQSLVVGGKRTIPDKARRAARAAEIPAAIRARSGGGRARDVDKRYRIPMNRILTLKERAAHPFAKCELREIDVYATEEGPVLVSAHGECWAIHEDGRGG